MENEFEPVSHPPENASSESAAADQRPPTAMEIVTSFFRFPAGGGGGLNFDNNTALNAGFIMMGFGVALIFLTSAMVGGPFMGQMIGYMLLFCLFFLIFNMPLNFLGLKLGDGKGEPGYAIMGTGACMMFFGITSFLSMLIVRTFATQIVMSIQLGIGKPNFFIIGLMYAFILWFQYLYGIVAYGLWKNLYKVSPGKSAWFSGIMIAFALGLAMWLFLQIEVGPMMDEMPFGRTRHRPYYDF